MPLNFTKNAEAAESLRKVLFDEEITYELTANVLNRAGEAAGLLCRGNLSLLCALNGSKSDIDTDGKILFIEDVDEYLYHIDRMIISLKRSGKLGRLAGLIVGGLTGMKDNAVAFGKPAEEILKEAVSEFDYPVCFGFPAGHVDKNMALVFGREARLRVSGKEAGLSYL